MKFLNLNNGYSFDALWKEDQSKGYIFWFPKEQSTGLIYTMPIAIIANNEYALPIQIEQNDIFCLIDPEIYINNIDIDGFNFDSEFKSVNMINSSPQTIYDKNGKANYVHVFYVAACAENVGEYICKISIGNEGFIRVGIDTYGENESLYVNLSNFGIELPSAIQKAIYDSNVHEDVIDNILVNRKMKELLCNYWDIIANKGSYKSLLNSVKWFEWGDALQIKEIWKHNEAGKVIYNDTDIITIYDSVQKSLNNNLKTSYVSLYSSLYDEMPSYDNEYNPELIEHIYKWTISDIKLKIALLAKYFGKHFLPIHMSILHAVAETKVFTNTIKSLHDGEIKRDDCFGDFTYVQTNIKDTDIFKIGHVRTQVTSDTTFAEIGVDIFPKNSLVTEDNIDLFATNYYTGPGVVIPIELIIPNQKTDDYIKKSIISCNDGYNKEYYNIFKVDNGQIKINFNFLAKYAGTYNLYFTFITASSNTITRVLTLNVENVDNLNINIYKVVSKDDSTGFALEDFMNTELDYMFKIQDGKPNDTYVQYLPCLPYDKLYDGYTGIKLNRTLVIKVDGASSLNDLISLSGPIKNAGFLEFVRYDDNNKPKYLVYVSNKFYLDTNDGIFKFDDGDISNNLALDLFLHDTQTILLKPMGISIDLIRNDLGFYPQFHELQIIGGGTPKGYEIKQYEAICCAAEIENGGRTEKFRYANDLDDVEWTFISNKNVIEHPSSSNEPFIADTNKKLLDTGFYGVEFKYCLNGKKYTHKLDSAFRVVND